MGESIGGGKRASHRPPGSEVRPETEGGFPGEGESRRDEVCGASRRQAGWLLVARLAAKLSAALMKVERVAVAKAKATP